MGNDKHMNPMSGDRVETDAVYTDPYGREVELKAGDAFPMDPHVECVIGMQRIDT